MKYEIINYDVWGNSHDGFEVNQAFHTGDYIELPENPSDYLINRRLGLRGVVWEGEMQFGLYGTVKRNGYPALELRPVNN
jgi:hypothetical protein